MIVRSKLWLCTRDLFPGFTYQVLDLDMKLGCQALMKALGLVCNVGV